MKYTRDNIIGKTFLGSTIPYINLRIEGGNIVMGYPKGHENFGREFVNSLILSLEYFNSGTWKILGEENKLNENYSVY